MLFGLRLQYQPQFVSLPLYVSTQVAGHLYTVAGFVIFTKNYVFVLHFCFNLSHFITNELHLAMLVYSFLQIAISVVSEDLPASIFMLHANDPAIGIILIICKMAPGAHEL